MRISLTVLFLFLSLQILSAQTTRYGIEFGQNSSLTKVGDLRFNTLLTDSYHAGFVTSQGINKHFSLQSGILYMHQNYARGVEVEREFSSYNRTYYISSMNNLVIPFDLIYHAPHGISIGVGVFGAYNLSHGPVLNPDCLTGVTELNLPIYKDPITYGARYSISADIMENESLGLGFALRYYEQYFFFETGDLSSYSNTTSLSVFINYKGKTGFGSGF
jgi:hypothetical protein